MLQTLTLESTITDQEDGQRLLDLLANRFAYHDARAWRQMVDDGQVLLNGATAEYGQLLNSGDKLTYRRVNHCEPEVPTNFETILETSELLVVGKPAGTPVSRTGLIIHNTFANVLRRHYQQDIHLLHRLDRETSGLLLCARDKDSCRLHQKDLKRIMLNKYYLAVVRGRLSQGVITVDEPLATRKASQIRCQMWPAADGKACHTIFHKIASNHNFSLVLAELITGRKHQIRAHLAYLDLPLVGDKIYAHGGKYYLKRISAELTARDYRELGAHDHLLHAWAAHLKLPGHPSAIYFSEIFSAEMKRYLENFPNWENQARTLLRTIDKRNIAGGSDHNQPEET